MQPVRRRHFTVGRAYGVLLARDRTFGRCEVDKIVGRLNAIIEVFVFATHVLGGFGAGVCLAVAHELEVRCSNAVQQVLNRCRGFRLRNRFGSRRTRTREYEY